MLYICIFSNKFDLIQAILVSHIMMLILIFVDADRVTIEGSEKVILQNVEFFEKLSNLVSIL